MSFYAVQDFVIPAVNHFFCSTVLWSDFISTLVCTVVIVCYCQLNVFLTVFVIKTNTVCGLPLENKVSISTLNH